MGRKGKSRKNLKVRNSGDSFGECRCGSSGSHHHHVPCDNNERSHGGGGGAGGEGEGEGEGGVPNGSQNQLSTPIPFALFPRQISILDLTVDFHHQNRVLSGTFCVDPFIINSVHTVLEDKFGNTVRVLIYDDSVIVSKQNLTAVARYAKGRNAHILEPYHKTCLDGGTAVYVDDYRTISSSDPCEEESLPPTITVVKAVPSEPGKPEIALAKVHKLRCEGNRAFSKQEWKIAINLYTECIVDCLQLATERSKGENNDSSKSSVVVKLNETLLLAYSNRSETWLRLRNYDDCQADANKALELDSQHVKSLVRKGKALHEIQQYELAGACFRAASKESPDDASIQAALTRTSTSKKQSEEGNYHLSDFYLSSCTAHPPLCADYVGHVEIRRPNGGRRGLFTTKDVVAGELLLVSNAIAVCRKENLHDDSDDSDGCGECEACENKKWWNTRECGRRDSRYVDELASQLRIYANSSKRRMHQVCTLAGANSLTKVDIPNMDLFRADREWTPPRSEKLRLSSDSFRDIVVQNSIDEILNDPRYFMGEESEQLLSAVWLLPSIINHSCCANAETWLVGNAMFVRACRPISSGEELTRSYFDILKGLERRQEAAKRWSFTCNCPRCEWEGNIPEPQNKARKKLCSRVHEFFFEAYSSSFGPNLEKLASLVSSVENTIESVKLDGKFRLWIRASLMDAYIANVHVLVGNPTRRIEAMKTVLEAMTEVAGGLSLRLQIASSLLQEVKRKHGKGSTVFRYTEAYVMRIYKPYYGDLNRKAFWTLAKMHACGDDLD